MSATKRWAVAGVAAVLCACKPGTKREDAAATGKSEGPPIKAATIGGFQTPESVKWDSARDVYYVSNINGAPNAKDGNGYISRMGAAGMVTDSAFIKGLNAPKGMALSSTAAQSWTHVRSRGTWQL